MKVSNETKVGALAAIAITLLILGFNFLKGKTFFSKNITYFVKFEDLQGLQNSNAVTINGMRVGSVYEIKSDKNMREGILVTLNFNREVDIPDNSIARIKAIPLSAPEIIIKLGDSKKIIAPNGQIQSEASAGIMTEVMDKINPVLGNVKNAVHSLDSVLNNVSSILDPNAKNNISEILANLNRTTAALTLSSASLNQLLNTQTGALAKSLNNVENFTGNLADNNSKLTAVMDNAKTATEKFSALDLEKTLTSLNSTIGELKSSIAKLNSTNGTAGMLLNDPRLYNNLASTANKLNTLIDDLKTNPKRYLSISVFGKKNKTEPLAKPLPDTTHAPYIEVMKQQ